MPSKHHVHNHLPDFPRDQIPHVTTSHVTESERNVKVQHKHANLKQNTEQH